MKDHVKLVFVYILEAHAVDEWPINSGRYNHGRGPVSVMQPTTNQERINLATRFQNDFDCKQIPMLVDSIGNEFEKKYAPWPLRFYGIRDDEISYVANPKECSFDPFQLRSWCLDQISCIPTKETIGTEFATNK